VLKKHLEHKFTKVHGIYSGKEAKNSFTNVKLPDTIFLELKLIKRPFGFWANFIYVKI